MNPRRYNPSTLAFRKGKWYVQVTKPKELQYGSDKQARRSTGTSDKHEARYMQHDLTQQIYEDFDKKLQRLDPVFELLRPALEAEGASTKQWYSEGFVELVVKGERTLASKMSGGAKISADGVPVTLLEKWKATNHVDLLGMITGLGHTISTAVISMLSQEDRTKVLSLSKSGPSELPTNQIIKAANILPPKIAANFIEYHKSGDPLIRLSADAKVSDKATLSTVLNDYLGTRSDKSRAADVRQLNKWLKHPHFSQLSLSEVEHYDAYDFLEEFDEELTKASIRVLRAAMSNVFNWAKTKRHLSVKVNPFRDLDLRSIGKDGTEKRPFSTSELNTLFALKLPPADRTALEVLLTTGMRGGELMQVQCISEEDGIKFLDLRKVQTKTKGSKRMVPLHSQLTLNTSFPLITNQDRLNRIIRGQFDDVRVTLHSLRHSFKDLARDAGVSEEMHKFITGHSAGDVSGSYGVGPSLKARHEAIMSMSFPWLT